MVTPSIVLLNNGTYWGITPVWPARLVQHRRIRLCLTAHHKSTEVTQHRSEHLAEDASPGKAAPLARRLPHRPPHTRQLKKHNTKRSNPHPHPHQDRKSTRLNSSHVAISYAVFRLKKKKDAHAPLV